MEHGTEGSNVSVGCRGTLGWGGREPRNKAQKGKRGVRKAYGESLGICKMDSRRRGKVHGKEGEFWRPIYGLLLEGTRRLLSLPSATKTACVPLRAIISRTQIFSPSLAPASCRALSPQRTECSLADSSVCLIPEGFPLSLNRASPYCAALVLSDSPSFLVPLCRCTLIPSTMMNPSPLLLSTPPHARGFGHHLPPHRIVCSPTFPRSPDSLIDHYPHLPQYSKRQLLSSCVKLPNCPFGPQGRCCRLSQVV